MTQEELEQWQKEFDAFHERFADLFERSESREQARKLGIERFEMSSGLNDAPTFIAALAELVIAALDVDRAHAPDVNYLVAAD